MANRIQLRRDSSTNWSTNNPTLFEGEVGLELDTRKIKVGNGTAAWNDLLYSNVTPEELAASIPSSVSYLSVDQSGRLVASNQNGFIIDAPAYIGNAESEDNRIVTQGAQQTLTNKTLHNTNITGFTLINGDDGGELDISFSHIDPIAPTRTAVLQASGSHMLLESINFDVHAVSDMNLKSSYGSINLHPASNAAVNVKAVYNGSLQDTIKLDPNASITFKPYGPYNNMQSSIGIGFYGGLTISSDSSIKLNAQVGDVISFTSSANPDTNFIEINPYDSKINFYSSGSASAYICLPGHGSQALEIGGQEIVIGALSIKPGYGTVKVNNQDVATQTWVSNQSYATQSYVGTQVSNLVNSAPTTLDTLKELADALSDDPNFATTITNLVGTKIASSQKGAANGVATLDSNGQVPLTQLGNASGGATASIHSFAMIG